MVKHEMADDDTTDATQRLSNEIFDTVATGYLFFKKHDEGH